MNNWFATEAHGGLLTCFWAVIESINQFHQTFSQSTTDHFQQRATTETCESFDDSENKNFSATMRVYTK
jgi:hypothetical protein